MLANPSIPVMLSDLEVDAALSGPAMFANRAFIFVQPAGVRLAFCEQTTPTKLPMFRASVYLSHTDAIQLKNLLASTLKDLEEQIAKATHQKE